MRTPVEVALELLLKKYKGGNDSERIILAYEGLDGEGKLVFIFRDMDENLYRVYPDGRIMPTSNARIPFRKLLAGAKFRVLDEMRYGKAIYIKLSRSLQIKDDTIQLVGVVNAVRLPLCEPLYISEECEVEPYAMPGY